MKLVFVWTIGDVVGLSVVALGMIFLAVFSVGERIANWRDRRRLRRHPSAPRSGGKGE